MASSSAPLFSVVIPTRERAETLRLSLQTCLDQSFDDFEVVVADNFSSPATREVVDAFKSRHIRCVRSDRPLSMSENWENGVAAAQGRYITLIGDDDGLMPYAFRELHGLLEKHDYPKAIHWMRGQYVWPTVAVPEDANILAIPLARGVQTRRGHHLIREVINFTRGAEVLPTIHTSIISRDVVQELRDRVGRVFASAYPDDFTSFAFGWILDSFLSVDVPMHLAGVSGHSNLVATLSSTDEREVATEFFALANASAVPPHPRVPHLRLHPVHTADAFEYAKQHLFPDDDSFTYDRQEMTVRYLEAIPEVDPNTRARYREVIRASLADRPDLQDWFDREAPDPEPTPLIRFSSHAMGWDGIHLRMDASALGVRDIVGAVNASTNLLGYRERVLYNLHSWHTLQAQSVQLRAQLTRAQRSLKRTQRALEVSERKLARTQARLESTKQRPAPPRALRIARKIVRKAAPRRS